MSRHHTDTTGQVRRCLIVPAEPSCPFRPEHRQPIKTQSLQVTAPAERHFRLAAQLAFRFIPSSRRHQLVKQHPISPSALCTNLDKQVLSARTTLVGLDKGWGQRDIVLASTSVVC